MGIDDGDSLREGVRSGRFMMIGDNHVDSMFPCAFHLGGALNPAIRRDEKFDAALMRFLDERHSNVISVTLPVRHKNIDVRPKCAKTASPEGCGSYSVAIIVAMNQDFLMIVKGRFEALASRFDVRQEERVVKMTHGRVEESVRLFRRRDSTLNENASGERMQIEFALENRFRFRI